MLHLTPVSSSADFLLTSPLYSQSEGHEDEYVQQSLDRLILQDLQTPDVPLSQSGCVCQERPLSGTAERRAVAGSLSPPYSNSRVREKTACVLWIDKLKSQPVRYTVHHLSSCLMLHTVCVHVLGCGICPISQKHRWIKDVLTKNHLFIDRLITEFTYNVNYISIPKWDDIITVLKDVNMVCAAICAC